MGIFLSMPSTEVSLETGLGAEIQFAVGEMQGWRKNMEDAHIAAPAVESDPATKAPVSLFGVFDGHGGKEVSLFVKQRYIEVLTSLPAFREGRYEDALRESFHKIDQLLEDESYNALLKEFRARPNPSDTRNNPRTPVVLKPLAAPFRTSSPESDDGDSPSSPTPIDKDSAAGGSDALKMIRELLDSAKKYRDEQHNQLGASGGGEDGVEDMMAESSSPGTTPSAFVSEQDVIAALPVITVIQSEAIAYDEFTMGESDRDSEDSMDSTEFSALSIKVTNRNSPVHSNSNNSSKKSMRGADPVTSIISEAASQAVTTSLRALSTSAVNDVNAVDNADEGKPLDAGEASVMQGGESPLMKKSESKKYAADDDYDYYSADSKGGGPGIVDPVVLRQSDSKLDLTKQTVDDKIEAAEQKSAKMITPSNSKKGLDDSEVDTELRVFEKETKRSLDDSAPGPAGAVAAAKTTGRMSGTLSASNNPPSSSAAAAASPPPAGGTNNFVCMLRDHRVLAGCTAIVAILVGDKLLVANAGDSRGVMCRNGTAVALSEDHKPTQDREMNRIRGAGGFVNFAGRVNGNLNLSRSLGDLKYKQSKQLPPEAQMITAEPDITVINVTPDDEFFVLACDGIWDCLTNQEACDFVRERVLERGLSLEEVIQEVMKRCLASDPRVTQGIGGDNMTFMVVWLKQSLLLPRQQLSQGKSGGGST